MYALSEPLFFDPNGFLDGSNKRRPMFHDDADSCTLVLAKFGQHPIEIYTALASGSSYNRESHPRVDPANFVVFGMKHYRVLCQVFDDGCQCFRPAQGVGGVETDTDARACELANNPCELLRTERFVILKRERYVLFLESRQNLPYSAINRGDLFRAAQAPGNDRTENSSADPARNLDITRKMLRVKASCTGFER